MKSLLVITAAGFLTLAGCYTVLRHEQVVIPAVDDAVEETNEAGVTVVSECATCHDETFADLDYSYHSFARSPGRYAMWLEYYESSEPWWITVPAHEAGTSSGEAENDDVSSERRNYGGRRTTTEQDHTTNTVTSGSTLNGGGSGTSTTSTSNSTTSTNEQDSGAKSERSTQDRTQRGPRSDGTQRETSGRKTNKK